MSEFRILITIPVNEKFYALFEDADPKEIHYWAQVPWFDEVKTVGFSIESYGASPTGFLDGFVQYVSAGELERQAASCFELYGKSPGRYDDDPELQEAIKWALDSPTLKNKAYIYAEHLKAHGHLRAVVSLDSDAHTG